MQQSDQQKKNVHSFRLTDDTVTKMTAIGRKLYSQQNPQKKLPGKRPPKVSNTKALELCIETMYQYMTIGQPLFLDL